MGAFLDFSVVGNLVSDLRFKAVINKRDQNCK